MPLGWYDVLLQLAEAPERRLRMAELADRVLLSRSGLTRLVDRLQAEGLVRARAVPGRRPRHVHRADTARARRGCAARRPSTWPGSSEYWLSKFDDDELRELAAARPAGERRLPPATRAAMSERARRAVVRDSLGVGRRRRRRTASRSARRRCRPGCRSADLLLSLLAFTGGTQFAVVGVVGGGGTVRRGARRRLLLGARNTLYAMRLAPLLRVRGAAPAGGRARHHRRVDGDGGRRSRAAISRGWRSGGRSPASSSSGTCPPCSAPWVPGAGRPGEVRPGRGDPGGVPRAARAPVARRLRSSGGSRSPPR